MWRKLIQSTYKRKARGSAQPADISEYREFLGTLAGLWTTIEGNIDNWIEIIHLNGGAVKIQKHLPSNLDRELDYIKAAIRQNLIPHDSAQAAMEILQEIHQVKGFRHTLIHGNLIECTPDGRIVIDHTRVRGTSRLRFRSSFTMIQRARHYRKTYDLAERLWSFLVQTYGPNPFG